MTYRERIQEKLAKAKEIHQTCRERAADILRATGDCFAFKAVQAQMNEAARQVAKWQDKLDEYFALCDELWRRAEDASSLAYNQGVNWEPVGTALPKDRSRVIIWEDRKVFEVSYTPLSPSRDIYGWVYINGGKRYYQNHLTRWAYINEPGADADVVDCQFTVTDDHGIKWEPVGTEPPKDGTPILAWDISDACIVSWGKMRHQAPGDKRSFWVHYRDKDVLHAPRPFRWAYITQPETKGYIIPEAE